MGIGPAPAIRAVCARAGLTLADIDRFEINEAFGAQAIACVRELGLDDDRLNVCGGAIAIGHPLGGDRRAPSADRRAAIAARRLALWRRFGLYRRRTGHRDDRGESRGGELNKGEAR